MVDEPGPKTWIEGRLRLTENALELDVPADQIPLEAWAGKRYTLIDGAPACRDIVPEGDPEPPWTVLGPAVPAPREWAEQDLAGRSGAETWEGAEPERLLMEMVSVLDGWMVVSISHGAGASADNYVYRTHDGGVTWQEAAKLEEAGRYPSAVKFFDDLHALVGIELYDGTPVFVTRDGGESWRRAEFPPPVGADGWMASSVSCSKGTITLSMVRREPRREVQLVSRDWGETWETDG